MMSSSHTCTINHHQSRVSSTLLSSSLPCSPYVAKVAVQHFHEQVDGLECDQLILVLGDARDEVETRVSTVVIRNLKSANMVVLRISC